MNPKRLRRYLMILGLLGIAGLLMLSWYVFRERFPNFFDSEKVDAGELERLKGAKLGDERRTSAYTDSPQFRGPLRDGWVPGATFRTNWNESPPKVLWSKPCGGGYSSFAVTGDRLITMDREDGNERIRCLDPKTGDELWSHDYPVDYGALKMGYAGGPRATPTLHGEMLYTVGATGKMLSLKLPALPKQKPTVAWEHDLIADYGATIPQWGVACSPLVEGALVIVQPGGTRGSIVAFDRITGEQRWTCGIDPSGYSSPIAATLAGVRQIVAVTGKSVLGMRAETGEVLWKHEWVTQHNGNIAMPVIAGDYVFVSSAYNKGCALLRIALEGGGQSARVVYFHPGKLMQNHHSTSVHTDGYLFGFDNNILRCIDIRGDQEVADWVPEEVRNRLGKGSVVLLGDKLLCLSEKGSLFLTNTDPKDFQLLGRMDKVLTGPECWALPALLDGKIYLRDATKIVCLDVSQTK